MKDLHALAFYAKANSEDNPCYHEVMNSPNADGFRAALELVITQIQKKEAWEFLNRDYKILRSTWVFKVKKLKIACDLR